MLRLSENPHIGTDPLAHSRAVTGRWFIAHTRSRCEKAFAWELHHAGIPYFLPLTDRFTISGGKKRHGRLPLTPMYVFINGDESTRQWALQSNRVCRVLSVLDQQSLCVELGAVYRAVSTGMRCEPVAKPQGERCRLTAGVLGGVQGLLAQQFNDWSVRTQVVLPISVLNLGVQVDVDSSYVQVLAASEELPELEMQMNVDFEPKEDASVLAIGV